MSIIGSILGIVFVSRILLWRILVPEEKAVTTVPETGEPCVNEMHLGIIFVVLLLSTLISEIVGQHYYLGPIVFGLSLPDSSPLGTAVVSKLDTFVSGLLYPTFLAISGLKTDIFSVSFQLAWKTAVIVFIGVVARFVAVMVPAMQGKIPFQEAFVLGLVMNTRGITELIIYNLFLEDEKMSSQDFTLLVISSALVTAIISPLVKLLYDPSSRYATGRRMTIQNHNKDGELRMVLCVHQHNNVPTLVNILEASNASEQNPIAVIVIVLVEVVGKSAAMLLAYRPQRSLEPSSSSNNHITNAFQQYERQNEGKASVQVYTNMSHFDAMHDDIRRVAANKRANFIILPFHKQWAIDGTVGAVNQPIREMNLKLLECIPCSLGILIDRGPSNNSSSSLNSKSVYQVAVLFVGGADDTEALAYGTRMVKHQRVVVTVTRFLLLGQDNKGRKHESETIEEFRKSNSGNARFLYQEVSVTDSTGLTEYIRNMDNYDLIIVGRSHPNSPLLLGLHEWSECPELGVIADLLASPDGETTSSVLVIQQQKMTATTNKLINQQSTRNLFIHDEQYSERSSIDRLSVHSSPSVAISIDIDKIR
ncbi:cation/H(+) antiporter 15-like [Amaranthus tricolor]|uniref:cation/H(+) antiporter 15-like n=1 Tax=Amaranthus tricolor TaxID=29722 RepID=UPI0025854921|nr:cation/H(+) antiporter 15-like [Amaranthus tricolor]